MPSRKPKTDIGNPKRPKTGPKFVGPDMKAPKNINPPQEDVEVTSPFGYKTRVTEKEVERLLRLGWSRNGGSPENH